VGDVSAFLKLQSELLENALDVLNHIIVPETHYSPAMGLEPNGASCIFILAPTVLAAIHFDNERRFDACEIDNICANRHLSAEAMTE